MRTKPSTVIPGLVVASALILAGLVWGVAPIEAQDIASLSRADPPAGGIWIDSLDLSKAAIRRPRAGRGAAGQPAPAPPLTYSLGGVMYPHAVPVNVNADVAIDLKGAAARFVAMVGLDDPRPPTGPATLPVAGSPTGSVPNAGGGRAASTPAPPVIGTVTFDVWVDGKHVFDSGLMRTGDAPKLVSVDLTGAKRMILAINDGGDGTRGDTAEYGGALLILKPPATQQPEVILIPREANPPIASSRTSEPRINYPRITGATPGRPFQFLIPASGDAPLTFAAKNLPAGLTLDAKTGIISGSLRADGSTVVDLTVTNAKGKATSPLTIVGGQHKLALTPPLGWNSWNIWRRTVDDAKVRAAADGMVSSALAAQGYTYINIDDIWEGDRDANGEITSNEKFPNMKALTDYIHGKGLKAGIYSGPGSKTCGGMVASYQHEEQDARTWAKWGFDYIKYDWCSYTQDAAPQGGQSPLPVLQKPYVVLRSVLDLLDRDFVMSLCQYGYGSVWEWGAEVGGNVWRVTGDITDNWSSMSGIGFQQTGHEKFAGPGHWNDTDMLEVGKVYGGANGTVRDTLLTPNEQITHITLWSLQGAPLLIGADMSQIDEFTTNLLGNPEVLSVSQDALGRPLGRLFGDGRTDLWARKMIDGTVAVGLFNRGPEPTTITVTFADVGLSGSQPVRDLWMHRDLANATNQFSAMVPRHGAVLVRIGKPAR
jgi:alpha-galactosidase